MTREIQQAIIGSVYTLQSCIDNGLVVVEAIEKDGFTLSSLDDLPDSFHQSIREVLIPGSIVAASLVGQQRLILKLDSFQRIPAYDFYNGNAIWCQDLLVHAIIQLELVLLDGPEPTAIRLAQFVFSKPTIELDYYWVPVPLQQFPGPPPRKLPRNLFLKIDGRIKQISSRTYFRNALSNRAVLSEATLEKDVEDLFNTSDSPLIEEINADLEIISQEIQSIYLNGDLRPIVLDLVEKSRHFSAGGNDQVVEDQGKDTLTGTSITDAGMFQSVSAGYTQHLEENAEDKERLAMIDARIEDLRSVPDHEWRRAHDEERELLVDQRTELLERIGPQTP